MNFDGEAGEIIVGSQSFEYTKMGGGLERQFLLEDLIGRVRVEANKLPILRIAIEQALAIPEDQRTDEAVLQRLQTIKGVSARIIPLVKNALEVGSYDDDVAA